jgi:TonB-dependent starch-binding outer membrane protein SusC
MIVTVTYGIRLLGCGVVMLSGAGCATGSARLPDSKADEISIGYGTETEETFTGSASSLSAEDMSDRSAKTVAEMLEGRVPGLQVMRRANGDVALRIRGSRSLQSDNEPLVVIDGTPIQSGSLRDAFAGLTPQDIERIDVLKDAGSTAVYGVRGANGVIIIRTKRGR